MKIIKSLENRGILLKGTTRKITSQEGGFSNFLRPLLTAGLPLMKSVLTPLTKSLLLKADATIQKKNSRTTGLIISNIEIEDIIKIVKSLEESELLMERINKTITDEAKEQKGRFISILWRSLAASMLGSALQEEGVIRVGEGTIRAGGIF